MATYNLSTTAWTKIASPNPSVLGSAEVQAFGAVLVMQSALLPDPSELGIQMTNSDGPQTYQVWSNLYARALGQVSDSVKASVMLLGALAPS